jgi:hypothetical protein
VSDIMSWAETVKAAEPSCAGFADAIYFAARQLDFRP